MQAHKHSMHVHTKQNPGTKIAVLCDTACSKVVATTLIIEEKFVQDLHSYVLSEYDLRSNGYPRPTSDPDVASIVRKPNDTNPVNLPELNGMCCED